MVCATRKWQKFGDNRYRDYDRALRGWIPAAARPRVGGGGNDEDLDIGGFCGIVILAC